MLYAGFCCKKKKRKKERKKKCIEDSLTFLMESAVRKRGVFCRKGREEDKNWLQRGAGEGGWWHLKISLMDEWSSCLCLLMGSGMCLFYLSISLFLGEAGEESAKNGTPRGGGEGG